MGHLSGCGTSQPRIFTAWIIREHLSILKWNPRLIGSSSAIPPYSWSPQAHPTFRTGSVSKDPRYFMTRRLLRHVGLVFVSTVVSAQPPPPPPPMFIGMPAAAPSGPLPQMPPRDNSQPAKPRTATRPRPVAATDTS